MLIEWYRRQIAKLPIEVKLNTEVKDLSKIKADVIVVATGAKPKKLNIKGFDKTVEAIEYLNETKPVGNKVAIIGGGLTGCEIAYDLLLKGKEPFIVEYQDDIMKVNMLSMANSSYLRDYFNLKKMPIYTNSSVIEINNDNIVIQNKDGSKKDIKVDSVISAIGYTPAPLTDKHVKVVGDALSVGNLRTVVWRAWEVAEKI